MDIFTSKILVVVIAWLGLWGLICFSSAPIQDGMLLFSILISIQSFLFIGTYHLSNFVFKKYRITGSDAAIHIKSSIEWVFLPAIFVAAISFMIFVSASFAFEELIPNIEFDLSDNLLKSTVQAISAFNTVGTIIIGIGVCCHTTRRKVR